MNHPRTYSGKAGRQYRFRRLLKSVIDPRAYAHLFKVLNYYNYTHVAELRLAQVGDELRISPTANISNGRNIVLGSRVLVGAHCYLWAGNDNAKITIGNDVLIAPNVMVTTSSYRYNDGTPVSEQAMNEADVTIGDDVWIGYGAVVLPGVTIGDGAVIGANVVVRKDVSTNTILGVPDATVVGKREVRS